MTEKATKILCRNMKVLLFEDENIKDQYLKITTLTKFWGPLCKKIDWKQIMVKLGTNLKKVGVFSKFIKKSKGFPMILVFSGISWNYFCIKKLWNGSMDHGTMTDSRSVVDSWPWGGATAPGLGRSSG
jgi:hypothetical protein